MADIYKLRNQIKHYEWGSPHLIPEFLGLENGSTNAGAKIPYAEMWMGTHTGAPSQAEIGGKLVNLSELSGGLPFLFKLIAVEKPLSIQAHPNKEKAAEGFRQEEEAGLAIRAPTRNFKDTNHKPEMLCALSPFTLMAGFREFADIEKSLEDFLALLPQFKEIISPLFRALNTGSLAVFFRILFNLSKLEREYLSSMISEKEAGDVMAPQQWNLIKYFAAQYPEDPAILSPLYLNLITLQAGQVVFIPDGILHAYISGFGIELMANSDNVLRGGLTPKYIDIPKLMSILNFFPFMPPVFSPDSTSRFRYPVQCEDFSLSFLCSGGEKNIIENGPAICIVTEGEVLANGIKYKKGESFFISRSSGTEPVVLDGNYFLFAAAEGFVAV
ncbi:MAG: mannose-6-phosphate isomerase, class I [Treponema sp.]|jgi:mannose-6-phosphate isomerase|nr:mannose-6-phosphate isomerase, class I [Treponema sp.]